MPDADGPPQSGVKISVVTTTRNAAALLPTCLRSVREQTYPHLEHVIVDGVSTDDTVALARRMLRPTDKIVSEPDKGIYDAMNRGVALSTGDYILFLGADDYLYDAKAIADAAACIEAEGRPEMLYGSIEVREQSGARAVFHPPPPEEALDLMICGCLPHQATFAHRRMFTELVGGFDLSYRVQSDYDWFLRALVAPGARIRSFRRIVASFALGGVSSRLRDGQDETYRIQNAFPLYREPEWMEKRLHAFQRETLELRIRLQIAEAQSQPGMAVAKSYARRIYRKLASVMSRQ